MKFYGKAEESAKAIHGGCWEYIRSYAERAGLEVIDACGKVLQRACEAVALIPDTAAALREREGAVA